ncbi:cilia- and flagella-associated protein 161 [Anolis sagrei]|uniref:cilia- and flagella-associated protein 161 n=1 Tax=Anolis sagrei TaxID=38937 RepID=UPI00351FCDFF
MFCVRKSMSGRNYSPGVLIGNWNEDVYLEEELLKDFLHKREKGELLIQKSERLKDNLYKKEHLSISKDGFVHFGDTVLLVNPDDNTSAGRDPTTSGDLSLAVNPEEEEIHRSQKLVAPCGVSAVRSVTPIGRNAFRILSIEGEAMGEPLRFGQNFGLGATGGFPDQMLYLMSDHKTFMNMTKKSHTQSAFMTDELTYLASWQAIFLDPQFRLEYEGFPVPANTKILIVHSYTNQGLAIHRDFYVRTYFGKEYEVNCHTYLDTHKAEKDMNHWVMVTGNPSSDATTMFDRPNPPSEETRIQNAELQDAT